jgi:hypothetical protein
MNTMAPGWKALRTTPPRGQSAANAPKGEAFDCMPRKLLY